MDLEPTGVSLVTSAPEPINAISVTVATVAPLLLMGAVVWGLTRRYPSGGWLVGLAIFALVSSIGLFAFSADTATALTLAAMHFVTGFAWFIALMPWVKTPVAR